MIPKLFTTDSYDHGQPASTLVRQYSAGTDSEWLRKHASSVDNVLLEEIKKLKPQKGKSVIHLIALSNEERNGPNRNMDGFSRKDNVTAHTQFRTQGHAFADHKNSDPNKSIGKVAATAHNDLMDRVELLVELDHKKMPDRYRQALEEGKDLAWSMGSLQKYDTCSHCGHKAPTSKDHCLHIKTALGEVLEDGTQIYMKNPNPSYFDISVVGKPADRIGYSLQKVAYGNGIVGGHELAEQAGWDPMAMRKRAALIRMAEIEKRIPLQAHVLRLNPKTVRELKVKVAELGIGPVLAYLHKHASLLSPRDFADIIVGHANPEQAAEAIMAGPKLASLLDDPIDIESLASGEDRYMGLSKEAEADIRQACGCETAPFTQRALRPLLITPKTASLGLDPHEADGLALLYQHYKLACALENQEREDVFRSISISC
jgi:hypothetical protein